MLAKVVVTEVDGTAFMTYRLFRRAFAANNSWGNVLYRTYLKRNCARLCYEKNDSLNLITNILILYAILMLMFLHFNQSVYYVYTGRECSDISHISC